MSRWEGKKLTLSSPLRAIAEQTPYYFLTAYTTIKCPELDPNSILPAVPLIISNFTSVSPLYLAAPLASPQLVDLCPSPTHQQGFGRIFAGILADRVGPVNTLFLSFFLGGLLQLVFWPFAQHYGSIIAFGALEGFTGSWFMVSRPLALLDAVHLARARPKLTLALPSPSTPRSPSYPSPQPNFSAWKA